MHIETFLYMLLQSDKTLPPPGIKPDFESLAYQAKASASPHEWIKVPRTAVTIGKNEDEFWAWDNEMPARSCTVEAFEARSQPVTNGEYAQFLLSTNKTTYPTSWLLGCDPKKVGSTHNILTESYSNTAFNKFIEDKAIRTVYGPVPLLFALDWPAMGSYDELSDCIKWMGGRIPTMEEARSIYVYANELRLSHSDDEEGSDGGLPIPEQPLFADLNGCNVGFRNFHPVPVNLALEKLAGHAGMGGVWEWTSSTLEKWHGFEAMQEYPGYTGEKDWRRSRISANAKTSRFL
jgi:L-histidine Nalpha-methyltransferase / hercynylcysteine S-oxide synthase